jgi:ABC-2 type transport system ATP-binding protein
MSLAIDVSGLSKNYGDRVAVDRVSLAIGEGRICGFLGPNGSGKTTTMRMICGLVTPDAGDGSVLGFDLRRERTEIKRRIGYMTQRFGLFEDLSVRENLDLTADIYDVERPRARIAEVLGQFQLEDRCDQLVGALSGGWKQRLALAACILHNPSLLLLDEPTAGVDPQARREFWGEIHALARRGVTVLVSTHYMDEAERCHDIAYLASGRLLVRGQVDAIVADSRLHALVGRGGAADRLVDQLRHAEGVASVAAFGTSIHICGLDAEALERAIAPFREREGTTWAQARPTLEDVFIYLMSTGAREPTQ